MEDVAAITTSHYSCVRQIRHFQRFVILIHKIRIFTTHSLYFNLRWAEKQITSHPIIVPKSKYLNRNVVCTHDRFKIGFVEGVIMSFHQGQHVTANGTGWARIKVVILEIRGSEALVQELGTARAEWIPLSWLSK